MGAGDVDPGSPPPVPAGWVPAPPDFVGIGVQKAGTTWWYDALAAHPCVHHVPGRPKELHFFDRFWAEPFGPADVATYHRWFARPAGTVAGEWTPRYLHDWWVPDLLFESAPSTRLLVLLRDPLDRYLSGIAHEVRSRRRRDPAIPGDALRRSCYGAQLRRLLRTVPAEQVLVQQFERCVREPLAERARAWEHLGLSDDRDAVLPDAVNVTEHERPHVEPRVLEQVREQLLEDLQLLLSLPFDVDPGFWPSARRGRDAPAVASR